MTTNMGQSITFPQFMCSWIKPILVKKIPKEKCHSRSVFSLEECNGLKLDSSNWKMAINGWNMTGSKSNDDWPCGLIIKQLHTSLIGSHPLEDRYIIVRCSRFWIVKMLMDLWKGNKNTDSQCVMVHGARCYFAYWISSSSSSIFGEAKLLLALQLCVCADIACRKHFIFFFYRCFSVTGSWLFVFF